VKVTWYDKSKCKTDSIRQPMFPARRLYAEVLVEDRDFRLLKEEWENLYRNSPLATPFQSWAWLYSWWKSYREDYELRLVTLRHGNLLVGLIPLILERRWGFFSRLILIGNGLTDYSDMLVREHWEAQVAEAGIDVLRRIDSWQVADLQEPRPEAAAWNIFQLWPGTQTHIFQSSCPVIDAKPWHELLMSLTAKQRSDVRRTLRRAEKDGVVCTPASKEDAEKAARRFVGLHREMWRGRDINPEHMTEKFESHMVTAASRLTSRGLGGYLSSGGTER
jgi:CelD/BcsL family acetyltransferase involved in cellulose biosynthesis